MSYRACRLVAFESGRGFASNWATQLGAEQDIISVDRRALAGESSRMVLLHVPFRMKGWVS